MSHARRTRHFARRARRGEKNTRDLRSSPALSKMPRSPRLALKAPVMQATILLPIVTLYLVNGN